MPSKRPLILDGYSIKKARYMELLYFCQQYPDWEDEYAELHGISAHRIAQSIQSKGVSDPTGRCAERALTPLGKMQLIEQAAIKAGAGLYRYIIKNVCYQIPYETLNVPCGRRQFYSLRRKFFYILDEKKEVYEKGTLGGR